MLLLISLWIYVSTFQLIQKYVKNKIRQKKSLKTKWKHEMENQIVMYIF